MGDADDCVLTTTVDGEVMQVNFTFSFVYQHILIVFFCLLQNCSTLDMIWTIPQLVSFLSQGTTLHPGDVILTGTPEVFLVLFSLSIDLH